MMNKLALLKRRLLDAEFNIADEKTVIVCSGGGFTLPDNHEWPKQYIGDQHTPCHALGAEFTISQGFTASLDSRLLKSTRSWYAHKNLFLTNAVELGTRFNAATATSQSTLFWGLMVSTLHKTTQAKVDTQALHIARLTAGCYWEPRVSNGLQNCASCKANYWGIVCEGRVSIQSAQCCCGGVENGWSSTSAIIIQIGSCNIPKAT
eukprot:4914906-Amphidinium_carterae.1